MILLDTDVLSALMREPLERQVRTWLDGQALTSIWTTSITVFEIRFGLGILPAGKRRSDLAAEFERVLADDMDHRVLQFDTTAAVLAADLMAGRQKAGRRIELRDTMIAGIALASRGTLATRNTKHFADLSVPLVNPWLDN